MATIIFVYTLVDNPALGSANGTSGEPLGMVCNTDAHPDWWRWEIFAENWTRTNRAPVTLHEALDTLRQRLQEANLGDNTLTSVSTHGLVCLPAGVDPQRYVVRLDAIQWVVVPFTVDGVESESLASAVPRSAMATLDAIRSSDVSLICSADGGTVQWTHGSEVSVADLHRMAPRAG